MRASSSPSPPPPTRPCLSTLCSTTTFTGAGRVRSRWVGDRSNTPPRRDDPFIVDARRMPGGEALPFGEAQDVVLYRVDPRAAVLQPDFFVDKLKRVLDCADSATATAP